MNLPHRPGEHIPRICRACIVFWHHRCAGPGSTCDCYARDHQPDSRQLFVVDLLTEQRSA